MPKTRYFFEKKLKILKLL